MFVWRSGTHWIPVQQYPGQCVFAAHSATRGCRTRMPATVMDWRVVPQARAAIPPNVHGDVAR